jgi:hypothetical protein
MNISCRFLIKLELELVCTLLAFAAFNTPNALNTRFATGYLVFKIIFFFVNDIRPTQDDSVIKITTHSSVHSKKAK